MTAGSSGPDEADPPSIEHRLGLLVLAWPGATVRVIAWLFAVQLVVCGVLQLVSAFSADRGPGGRVLFILLGALSILVGLLCLREPLQTALVLGLLIGAMWVVQGVVGIAVALGGDGGPARGWAIASRDSMPIRWTGRGRFRGTHQDAVERVRTGPPDSPRAPSSDGLVENRRAPTSGTAVNATPGSGGAPNPAAHPRRRARRTGANTREAGDERLGTQRPVGYGAPTAAEPRRIPAPRSGASHDRCEQHLAAAAAALRYCSRPMIDPSSTPARWSRP